MHVAKLDYEITLLIYELTCFALGKDCYAVVPFEFQTAQLDHFATLQTDLYPTLRLHAFDARRLFSTPITVIRPLLAVMYLGQNYLAFCDSERVYLKAYHVGTLVREASIMPHNLPNYFQTIKENTFKLSFL